MSGLKSETPFKDDGDVESRTPWNKSSDIKINVCFMIDELSSAGTEKHLLGLIQGLDRKLFTPTLVLLRGMSESSRALEPTDCKVVRLGLNGFFQIGLIHKTWEFIRLLKALKIDILQMYFPDSTLFGASCGKLAGVPNLIRTRRNAGYWMKPSYRIRSWIVSRLVGSTIANSQASKQSVIQQEFATSESVVVIRNGINLQEFGDYKPNATATNRPFRIGMLANLRPVKHVEDFIRSAAFVNTSRQDCVFAIGGEGPMRAELQMLINELGISRNVRLVGTVLNVPEFLSNLDIMVSCSSSEGLSNTVMEGMAAGIPVIATKIPGNQELVKDGETGLLFAPHDTQQLSKLICDLLDDPILSSRLRLNARAMIEEQFGQDTAIQKYQDYYLQMAKSTNRNPSL